MQPPASTSATGSGDGTVPTWVRLTFAHACLQVLADEVGVDLLHIKGVATHPEVGLTPRTGSDADVLVRPAHLGAMRARLEEAGWTLYTDLATGSPFQHAATYHHQHWGFGDLHRYFPGVGITPDLAFDHLWAGRTSHELAAIHCPVPSIPSQLLITLLNLARAGGDSGRLLLAQHLWEGASEGLRAQVQDEIAALRCEVAFSAALGTLEQHRHSRDYRLWKVSSQGGTRLEEWIARVVASSTPGAAIRLVARAPQVNVDHLSARLGRAATRAEIAREFFSRPGRGILEEVRRVRLRAGTHRRER